MSWPLAGTSTPADHHRRGGDPPPGDDAGVEPQHFLDRVRDQRSIATEQFPLLVVLEQLPHAVADQIARRLVAREAESVDDARDLIDRERRRIPPR